jgi:predicted phosphodiesterase
VPQFSNDKPLLVFGGPYSNLAATRMMRIKADSLGIGPRQVICTGDVVAYGAEPDETTQLIRDWDIHTIAGNCEEQLAAGAADCGCGFDEGSACDLLSKGWYPFANARISTANRTWMGKLPATLRFTYAGLRFRVIHGGVKQTNRFLFASDRVELAREAVLADADVIIAGHSGLPFTARIGPALWFNPGVIGMPANDGTPDFWYGLITPDPDSGSLTFATRRLSYDHHAAAAGLRRQGHANGYARTFVTGLWPSLDMLPEAERAATGVRLKQTSVRLRSKMVTTSSTAV